MEYTPEQIIKRCGGVVEVSRLCKCTKGAVSQWKKNGIPGPREDFLRLARPAAFADTEVSIHEKPVSADRA